MNDWLDYQGSGSSRAYIAHYGVKGMKWDPSKLFGKKDKEELDDKKVRARIEQDDADDYAVEKTWREKRSAEMDIERYTKQVEEIEKRIKEVEKQAADIEAERKKAAVASPLKAFQESTRREKNRKLQLEDLNKQLGYAKNGLSDAKRRLSIAQVKYDKYRQQRSKHTREYDGPYVNSVRHAEKCGTSMNDWLDYQGSGSSRAYANNTISHASWVPTGTPQFDADHRLITAYAEKMKKLKSEYKSLKSDYNKYMTLYNHNKDMAESQESNRAEAAKSGQVLRATQFFEKNVWRYKKDASDAKNEAVSCLTKMKANVDSQKKLQEDVKSIDDSDYRYSLERSSMVKRKANSLFIPDELPSNINQIIKQSYLDMPADDFIEHAFLGIESKKEREARLKDQKEKQSKAESALIDSQFDLAIKYQTEYNQNKDKLTKAKKSTDDLYSRYSETAAQLTKLEKQQREMSSSGVSQEVLRRNVPIIPQLRNKKKVLNDKYQEAYAKYIELRDRQKWLDDKLKSIVKYFDADGRIDSYGK